MILYVYVCISGHLPDGTAELNNCVVPHMQKVWILRRQGIGMRDIVQHL